MYEEQRQSLKDNLEHLELWFEEDEDGNEVAVCKLFAPINVVEEMTRCITNIDEQSREGFEFFFQELTKEQSLGLLMMYESLTDADELSKKGQSVMRLSVMLLASIYQMPCTVETMQQEENVSYLDACERVFDFIPSIQEYNEAHERGHWVLRRFFGTIQTEKWSRSFHISHN